MPSTVDPTVPSIARIYDYWLGGKDNFEVDREAAEEAIAANPRIVLDVRANRAFLARVVRILAGKWAIRQFLDIGTGLPTASSTHQVAQAVAAASRVVYVDNDPAVLEHARALLAEVPGDSVAYLDADLRDVGEIVRGAARTLDISKPIAVLMLIVLHLIPDSDAPWGVVAQLMDKLAPGSYLVISHPASDVRPAAMTEMARAINARLGSMSGTMRSKAEVSSFFDGLTLLDPGIVQPHQWRPAGPAGLTEVTAWCGVARKP